MFIWTEDAIYEIVPKVIHPEAMFFKLLQEHGNEKKAENFAKTFRMDILNAYEIAAGTFPSGSPSPFPISC